MESRIVIGAETVRAYQRTSYKIAHERGSIVLRIGERNDAMRELHRHANVASSAFVTACNPFGRHRSDSENLEAMTRLRAYLGTRRIDWLPGEGQGEGENWPAEPSVLALGVSIDQATALCVDFEQNAVVVIAADAIPRLLFHPRAMLPRT